MKINLKKMLFPIVFISIFFISCIAGIKDTNASPGPGIAIGPEYPKEQISKNGIFNVIFQSNKEYNLTLKISNTSDDKKTIVISPNTAYTSSSGNMMFDKSNVPKDSTRKYDFHSLFTQKEKRVTMPANSVNNVSFRLKMPSEQYQGIIAGGFYITIPSREDNTNNSNFKINNNFSYGLATVIHNQSGIAQPTLKLNDVNTNNDSNKLNIQSNIQNAGAGIISGMNINSEITKSNSNQIINKSNSSNLSMAPNSSFSYNNTINDNLAPGQYRVKLNATDSMGHHWKEEKEFKISTQNYTSHFVKQVPWKLYIVISVIVVLILLVIYLIYHQYKLKNKLNDKKNDSKK